ncbi:DUF3800 domain-containing protein [Pseudomonas nunensis]|uniref:DUF3800 domain-containing protein n=1 Tax=Pseudomonas nunensis TaxID=2961896 RepID=A0ABY5EIW9_9PSED|nr:DUF3800 domain-containing protein [Pseudomonas nunensis]KPN94095.1 hypothetical protein AL066_04315 [Pseudomonas nunensis]MCL5230603.1 DUF3800 domain-containing protein [Pseudomonas nunensis]UTO15619.1 DUF3800 domain-containing protein [Pseudomonas nunensis]
MECFRIDESGYTGFDLLNEAQPFQGASAIGIDDAEAARLIREYFPKLQAPELKYRSLSKRVTNHPRLLGLIGELLANHKCITYLCDKRFALLLKFVDYGVEPHYYERNINFYEDGRNYALASVLYYAGARLLGDGAMENLERAFQNAMKLKSLAALSDLVTAARQTDWRKLADATGPLVYADPDCLAAIATPGVTTDMALPVLMALISQMELMSDGPYRVEHDQSRNLLTYHDLLQRQIDHTDEAEFRQSALASIRYPLRLSEVTQVDSKTSPAVQLADVLIGATIESAQRMTGRITDGLDPQCLAELYRDDQIIHMLPSLDLEGQREFRKGTRAAALIDYFAENFSSSQ